MTLAVVLHIALNLKAALSEWLKLDFGYNVMDI